MERKKLRRRIYQYFDSIGDLCKEVGASQTFISLVLTGDGDPSFNLVRKMCKELKVGRGEIGELFFPELKE